MGLEFINIVSSNIQTPECTKDAPPPQTTTTTIASPLTTINTTTLVTTTEATTTPTTTQNDPESNDLTKNATNFRWDPFRIIFAIILALLIAIAIGVIYQFIIRPRIYTQTMHVTQPKYDPNLIHNFYDIPHVQTIPRLHVLHHPIEGPYISGVNYIKHLDAEEDGPNKK